MSIAKVRHRRGQKGAMKKHSPAKAFHGQTSEGEDLVGVENLRVVIVRDGDYWFAQGLEIDYAAQGKNVADVKRRFQDGMCATIHEHLRMYGNIEQFLRPAPREVWKELFYDATASLSKHSQVSCHSVLKEQTIDHFPFTDIVFKEVEEVVA